MVGEMETKEKPKPTPDYLMQLMNDKKLMSSLPNFCGIFNHLERLLDEGESPCRPLAARAGAAAPLPGTRRPPECGEGGEVAAGGDRAPGDGEARAGREEAAPRLGSRGAAGGPRRRDAPPDAGLRLRDPSPRSGPAPPAPKRVRWGRLQGPRLPARPLAPRRPRASRASRGAARPRPPRAPRAPEGHRPRGRSRRGSSQRSPAAPGVGSPVWLVVFLKFV